MNYDLLAAELAKPEYEGLDDADAAAKFRESTTVIRSRVITDKSVAGEIGMTSAVSLILNLTAAAESSPALKIALQWLHEGIDVGLPETREFLDSLTVGDSPLVPVEVVASIKAMAEVQVERWEAIELGRCPDFADIARVRGEAI